MTYILIKVTAENGVTAKYYIVEVTRAPDNASDDAKLAAANADPAGLSLGPDVTLSPSYDPDKVAYTASVPYVTTMVTVVATPANAGAMVMLTSDKDDDIGGQKPMIRAS